MELTIKYFGQLAEVTACREEQIEFSGTSVSGFRALLNKKYPQLASCDFQIAQDHVLITNDTKLSSGEIALLPPFAGG